MTSIAELGIRINTTEVAQAATDLDKLAQSGAKAEKAAVSLTQQTDKTEASTKKVSAAVKEQARAADQATASFKALYGGTSAYKAALFSLDTSLKNGSFVNSLKATQEADKWLESLTKTTKASGAAFVDTGKQLNVLSTGMKGLGASAGAPALSQIVKQSAGAAAELTKFDNSLTRTGITAKQTAAALRGVPAQFTDIAVSLQGGQAPLQVLLQQGGQLKDMFGGVGPAAKALGGYVVGLINPFTLAAAAAAGLAVAYNIGSKEADAYNKSLILSGKVAGTTAGALGYMAEQIGNNVGTTGAAAEVLAQLAGSGKIASDSFEAITTAALSMKEATGKAAEETVAEFVKIGKDPVAAAKELNDQYNFLTASIYSQIVAMKESGDTTGAARLLTEAYADAIKNRTAEITGNLGLIERAWLGIKNAALGALDSTLDVGRTDTLGEQLTAAKKQLADLTANGRDAAKEDPFRFEAATKEISFLEMQIDAEKTLSKYIGDRQKTQTAGISAMERVDALTKSSFTNEQKRSEEIKKYRLDLEKIKAANPDDSRLSQSVVDKQIANINDRYKDPKPAKAAEFREEAGSKLLQTLRNQESSLSAQLISDDKLSEAERKRAEITQQIADLKTRSVLTADQKSLLANESSIKVQLDKNVAIAEEVRLHNETIKLQERSAQIQASITSASDSRSDQRTSQLASFGLGRQASERASEDAGTRKEFQRYQDQLNKATPADQLGGTAYTIEADKIQEQLDLALAANQDYYSQLDEMQADWKNGASAAFQDYMAESQNVAGQTYDMIGSAAETLTRGIADSMAQLIVMSEDANEAMKALGRTVLTEALSSLIQLGLRYGINSALEMAGITAVTATKTAAEGVKTAAELGRISVVTAATVASTAVTTTTQVAAAGTTLAAWLPAALVASIGTFGAAAVVGGGALLAAFALTKGFKKGGYTGDGGTDEVVGAVHGKEYVFDAASTARIGKGNLDAMRAGKMEAPSPAANYTGSGAGAAANDSNAKAGGGVVVNLIEDKSRAGQSSAREQDGQQIVDLWIYKLNNDEDVHQAMASNYGLQKVAR